MRGTAGEMRAMRVVLPAGATLVARGATEPQDAPQLLEAGDLVVVDEKL
jgi:hypothetical protein